MSFLDLTDTSEFADEDADAERMFVKAMEGIAAELQRVGPEEKAALQVALAAMAKEERKGAARAKVLGFFADFMSDCGLDIDE